MSDNQNVILVQGPNNKIISLKIKSPTTKTENIIPLSNKSTIIKSQTDQSTLIKRSINTTSSSLILQSKPIDTTTKTTTTTTSSAQNEQKQQQSKKSKLIRIINPSNVKLIPSSTSTSTKSLLGNNVASSDSNSKTYKIMQQSAVSTSNLSLPNISSNVIISKTAKMINRNNIEPTPSITIEKKISSLLPSITIKKVSDEKQQNTVMKSQVNNQDLKITKITENVNKNDIQFASNKMTESRNEELQDNKLKNLLLKPFSADENSKNQISISSKTTEKSKSLIKIKNLDNMITKSINNKAKQQSLLKNKTLENVLRSPRTKGRSKSLNSGVLGKQKRLKTKSRRTSTASESKTSAIKKDIIATKKEFLIETNDKLNETEIQKSNLTTDDNQYKIKNCNILPQPPPLIRFDDLKLNYNNNPSIDKSKINQLSNSEVMNILKWNNGIGTTNDSVLSFHLNEFGLMEIYEKTVFRDRIDICYEKPIFERESKSQNTCDYVDPLYFCKGCNCHGAAVDFLAPNYCSYECIARYDKKKSKEHHKSIHDKKRLTYRKKRILNLPNIRNNWQQSKLIIPVDEIRTTDFNDQNQKNKNDEMKRVFSWTTYLSSSKAEPATIDLFLNPFPCGPNLFEVGMKLEAIDPEHNSLFCVCTIVEKKGFRLKLHFDGYPSMYDFWVNADSMDIFPPGWCLRTNRILQSPSNIKPITFAWRSYLIKTQSKAAPRHLFTHLNSSSITNPFKVGMKLEAIDLRNTRKACVASVADVLDNRILVHFDGWDEGYDYWVEANSPYIHAVNWHETNCSEIVPPPDWIAPFDWNTYIKQTNSIAAISDLFQTRDSIDFQPGMKLEVVDKKNPSLIRPGTVILHDEYELKVIFDGWPQEYSFWVADDNPDIHPIGWCEATGHELESPPGFQELQPNIPCNIPGCRGIGNVKHSDIDYHTTMDCCPYELNNWSFDVEKPERLENLYIELSEEGKMGIKRKLENDDYDIPAKRQSSESITILPDFEDTVTQLSDKSNDNIKNDNKTIIHPIYKQLLCDYGPRLEQNLKIWEKNSQAIRNFQQDEVITENPLNWSVDKVVKYISSIPLCKTVAEIFRREYIDGEALLSLRQTDLTDILNLKLGPTVKIYSQIIHLRAEVVKKFNDK